MIVNISCQSIERGLDLNRTENMEDLGLDIDLKELVKPGTGIIDLFGDGDLGGWESLDYSSDWFNKFVEYFGFKPMAIIDYYEFQETMLTVMKHWLASYFNENVIIQAEIGETTAESKVKYGELLYDEIDSEYRDNSGPWLYFRIFERILYPCHALFLDKGIWHIGWMNKQGIIETDRTKWPKTDSDDEASFDSLKPILWFGLEGEAPIKEFSVTCEGIGRGFSTEENGWEAILVNGDGPTIWVESEAGISPPENEAIISRCPINLEADDIGHELIEYMKTHVSVL